MIIEISRKHALRLDLLVCKCGHRSNNHFESKPMPCAHCNCEKYSEVSRFGKILLKGNKHEKNRK